MTGSGRIGAGITVHDIITIGLTQPEITSGRGRQPGSTSHLTFPKPSGNSQIPNLGSTFLFYRPCHFRSTASGQATRLTQTDRRHSVLYSLSEHTSKGLGTVIFFLGGGGQILTSRVSF